MHKIGELSEIVVHIGKSILDGNKGKEAEVLDALKNRREEMIERLVPLMDSAMLRYTFRSGDTLIVNAEEGDLSALHTVAKHVARWLYESLTSEAEQGRA